MKIAVRCKQILSVFFVSMFFCVGCAKDPIRVLLVTGQNNHNWQVSHEVLRSVIEQSELFAVDYAITPPKGGDMFAFKPDFSAYDVVLLDYNGDRWSEETDRAFLDFVDNGGGVVIYHAADNAFAGWDAFNRIIALGGWEGRNEQSGPYVYWKEDRLVRDSSAGPGGSHGAQREYQVNCRNTKHPITQGLPEVWMHAQDELYDRMRGPGNIDELLYTGYADSTRGGSGREEPLVFTVDYGKARILHLMLGHIGGENTPEFCPAVACVGFQTLLLRGLEWAATGKVTQEVPADFPSADKSVTRPIRMLPDSPQ